MVKPGFVFLCENAQSIIVLVDTPQHRDGTGQISHDPLHKVSKLRFRSYAIS